MKIIEGDLIELALDGEFDVIAHGCNCYCNMGGGIAATIAYLFPVALIADMKTHVGDSNKLGTYTSANIKSHKCEHEFTIINAYTQDEYTRDKTDVDYKALRSCFKAIKRDFSGKRIGYPLIGAGLAGGDWNLISKIIDEEFEGEDHTLVKYKPIVEKKYIKR